MTERERLAKRLRETYLEGRDTRRGWSPVQSTAWEELPHERRRKWLELAAAAENELAAIKRDRWEEQSDIRKAKIGECVRITTVGGTVIVGHLQQIGLGFVRLSGSGMVPIRAGNKWAVRRGVE